MKSLWAGQRSSKRDNAQHRIETLERSLDAAEARIAALEESLAACMSDMEENRRLRASCAALEARLYVSRSDQQRAAALADRLRLAAQGREPSDKTA